MQSTARSPSDGNITSGISPNALIDRTVSFVEKLLPKWRDHKSRPFVEAEEDLNGQLCKFLNDRARDEFPMAIFHHEEKQNSRRRVDLSVGPSSAAITAKLYDSIYKPFLVIEGKRLPAPAAPREREYLTGLSERSGGIQRFRLSLHGESLSLAVMIGYVQKGKVVDWRTTINRWIESLEASGEDTSCNWSSTDLLGELIWEESVNASRCESIHARAADSTDIRLVHLWVGGMSEKI